MAGCDADDLFLPRFVEVLGELAVARPDLDILVPTATVERNGKGMGSWPTGKPRFPADDLRLGILRDHIIPIGAGVRRQRLVELGGFDETLRCAEDYDVWLRLIFSGSRAGLVLEPLWVWRQGKGSLSTRWTWCMHGSIEAMTRLTDRSDLSDAERAVAGERMAHFHRILMRAEAKDALAEGRPDARRLSLRVAMGKGQGARARLKAALAASSPKWAGRRIET